MLSLFKVILDKVASRLFNVNNLDSKTQITTASSVPVATTAALMLMQENEPVLQFLGGVLAVVSAVLLVYKDGKD